jgi:hypothetical protein
MFFSFRSALHLSKHPYSHLGLPWEDEMQDSLARYTVDSKQSDDIIQNKDHVENL